MYCFKLSATISHATTKRPLMTFVTYTKNFTAAQRDILRVTHQHLTDEVEASELELVFLPTCPTEADGRVRVIQLASDDDSVEICWPPSVDGEDPGWAAGTEEPQEP